MKFPLPSRPDNLIEIYEVANVFDFEPYSKRINIRFQHLRM